ncbi:MAG: serine/threonine-protein kinase [Polyangiaceae bacterium]
MTLPIPVAAPGDLVDRRYRLTQRLGQGGAATVWLATDLGTGEQVALKLLHATLASHPKMVSRMLREGRLLERLCHESIVRHLATGTSAFGPYVVCEILFGETLRARLVREGALSIREAASIALQLLDALAAAHRIGVVHRDVKPENIFLLSPELSQAPQVKLIDFGIAKRLDDEDGEATQLTRVGDLAATLCYASPEQLGGAPVGPTSDLFSLGLTLSEMLGAPVPMVGPDLVAQVLDRLGPEPIRLDIGVRRSAIGHVIERAVSKRPEERHPAAELMAWDLWDVLAVEGRELVAAPPTERAAC